MTMTMPVRPFALAARLPLAGPVAAQAAAKRGADTQS